MTRDHDRLCTALETSISDPSPFLPIFTYLFPLSIFLLVIVVPSPYLSMTFLFSPIPFFLSSRLYILNKTRSSNSFLPYTFFYPCSLAFPLSHSFAYLPFPLFQAITFPFSSTFPFPRNLPNTLINKYFS